MHYRNTASPKHTLKHIRFFLDSILLLLFEKNWEVFVNSFMVDSIRKSFPSQAAIYFNLYSSFSDFLILF